MRTQQQHHDTNGSPARGPQRHEQQYNDSHHSHHPDFPVVIDEKHSSCDETTSSLDDEMSPRATSRRSQLSFSDNNSTDANFNLTSSLTSSMRSATQTNILPPLHPKTPTITSNKSIDGFNGSSSTRDPRDAFGDAVQNSFQRNRIGSTDTLQSASSSVVSVDAGKHGFIIHDDASSTGSLVLAYQPGQEVPPAEYDLPKSIIQVFDQHNRSVGVGGGGGGIDGVAVGRGPEQYHGGSGDGGGQYSSDQDYLLPYHIRSKRNSIPEVPPAPSDPHHHGAGWANDHHGQSIGYGSMAGIPLGEDLMEGVGFDDSFSQVLNPRGANPNYDITGSLSYSNHGSEANSRRGSANIFPPGHPAPLQQQQQMMMMMMQQRQYSYQSTSDESPVSILHEHEHEHDNDDDYDDYGEEEEDDEEHQHHAKSCSGQSSVYLPMAIMLVIFMGMIYGLFNLMKMMP